MSKLRGILNRISAFLLPTAKFMALMVPLLLVGGKVFGFEYLQNSNDIRNAVYASKLDCRDAQAGTYGNLVENNNLCVEYGKITYISPVAYVHYLPSYFTINFQRYLVTLDANGNQVETADGPAKVFYVGQDILLANKPTNDPLYPLAGTMGSGNWVWENLNAIRNMLIDAKSTNKVGALVMKNVQYDSSHFYVQGASASPKLFPWGEGEFAGDASDIILSQEVNEAHVWRTYSKRYAGTRSVSVTHLLANGTFSKDVDRTTLFVTKAEHIKARRYYQFTSFPYGWRTANYEVEDIKTGAKTNTTTKPATYTEVGDELPTNGVSCTASIPCLSGGVIAITLSNGEVFHVASKKFSKEQLDGINDPDNAKLPCPFAAYALEAGKIALKRALNSNWKFKFNYVNGNLVTSTVNGATTTLGDFSNRKWIIGRAISRETYFYSGYDHNNNEQEISEGLLADDKIDLLTNVFFANGSGGHVDYNEVLCSCLEVYF